MQDEVGAEESQRALGDGPVLQPNPQRHFPAQVEVSPGLGFLVRHALVGLKQQRRRQQAWRHTRPAVVAAVEVGEVLIPEQLTALTGQGSLEGVPPDMVQIEMVGLEQAALRRPLPEHATHPIVSLDASYQGSQAAEAFRPRF